MAAKAQTLVARWTVDKVPLDKRVLTLLVYDRSYAGSLLEPAAPEASRASRWLRRLLRTGKPSAETEGFLKDIQEEPLVFGLSFDGAAGEGGAEFVVGLAGLLVQACDGGGEVDVVTLGPAAVPALDALASVAGTTRGGVPVGVNKLISLGAPRQVFAQAPPRNALEWANVHEEQAGATTMDVADLRVRGGEPVRHPAGDLFPSWGHFVARDILDAVKSPATLEAVARDSASRAAQISSDRDRELATRAREHSAPGPSAAESSLGMIQKDPNMTAAGRTDAAPSAGPPAAPAPAFKEATNRPVGAAPQPAAPTAVQKRFAVPKRPQQ